MYETYALYTEADLMEKLPAMSRKEGDAAIKKVVANQPRVRELMNRTILADIEQNIFRGAIRNADCEGKMEYWIYCNATAHQDLIEQVFSRIYFVSDSICFCLLGFQGELPCAYLSAQDNTQDNT